MSAPTVSWPQVVLFGDSLTQRSFSEDGGWGSVIADRLQRRCDVITRGFSGYNTRWCRLLLPKLYTVANVDKVAAFAIFLGANDANSTKNVRQHVPLDEYRENMVAMVDHLLEAGVAREKIVLIGPPPCDVPAWERHCLANDKVCSLENAVTGLYAAASRDAAKLRQVAHVELYLPLQERAGWERCFCDGLHFSRAGAEAVAELVWPEIQKRVDHLPSPIFPEWSEVDHENPANSF